jgi:hypothetical protein
MRLLFFSLFGFVLRHPIGGLKIGKELWVVFRVVPLRSNLKIQETESKVCSNLES